MDGKVAKVSTDLELQVENEEENGEQLLWKRMKTEYTMYY